MGRKRYRNVFLSLASKRGGLKMPNDEQKNMNKAENHASWPLSLRVCLYRQLYLMNYDAERDK